MSASNNKIIDEVRKRTDYQKALKIVESDSDKHNVERYNEALLTPLDKLLTILKNVTADPESSKKFKQELLRHIKER